MTELLKELNEIAENELDIDIKDKIAGLNLPGFRK